MEAIPMEAKQMEAIPTTINLLLQKQQNIN